MAGLEAFSGDDAAFERAGALLGVGRAEQALAELARLPAALIEDRRAFRLRVEALIELARWDEAVAAARQGIEASGSDPRLLAGLGLALQAQGRYPEAERAFLGGLALSSNDVDLLCRYALLCIAVGQVEKAGKLLVSAAQEDHDAAIVYATRVELAFARGDDRLAERFSREFLAEYPEHPLALAMHGRSAALRGRVGPAYGSLRDAVALDPTNADTAEAAHELRLATHPLLVPLRPMYRLGVFKSWLVAAGLIVTFRILGWTVAYVITSVVWVLYAGYSWVAPVIVRRLAGVPRRRPEARWARIARWVGGGIALVVGLGCTGLAAVDIGPAVRAATGNGSPGTIVLTREDCVAGNCDWYGDFTSDDGSVVFTDAAMQEGVPAGAKVGDRLRALDTGARDGVYPASGSSEWIYISVFLVVGVILILGFVVAVPIMSLMRRR
jgi:tetratricopeptide (TPR) repeat protein